MRPKLLAKKKGEWEEGCFAAEILRRGWRISRPYGDSSPYDCIVDCAGRISPVPIKASCAWIKDRRANPHWGISRENYKVQISNDTSHFKICIAKGSRKKRGYSS